MPIAFAAAAPIAALGGTLVELARHADRPVSRAGLGIFGAAFAGTTAVFVSTGRLLAGSMRAPFVALVAALVFVAALFAGPPLARLLRPRSPRGSAWGLVASVLAAVLAIELANAFVLPRLYPAFHRALALLASMVVPFVTIAWDDRRAAKGADEQDVVAVPFRGKLARAALALGLFALTAAAAPAAAARLAPADNVRLVYLTHAPVLSNAVELAAALSPPPPLDEAPIVEAKGQAGRSLDLSRRDIVLVTIDALRADHVGAYGYARKTTPNIDALAADGVVFEHAYTPTPHTSYAVTSLMTGKYMRPLVLQGLGADSETWAGQLRRYGYRTAAFYPAGGVLHRRRALRRVPRARARLRVPQGRVRRRGAARSRRSRAYLDGRAEGARVFLWVHLFEPHEPYEAHPEHPFGDRDVDRYDAEIAAADAGIGAIVALGARARGPGAVVIVSRRSRRGVRRARRPLPRHDGLRGAGARAARRHRARARRRAACARRCSSSICCRRCSRASTSRGRRACAAPISARCSSRRRRARRTTRGLRVRRDRDADAARARDAAARLRSQGSARARSTTWTRIRDEPDDLSGARAAGEVATMRAELRGGRGVARALRDREGCGARARAGPRRSGAASPATRDAAVDVAALLDDADVAHPPQGRRGALRARAGPRSRRRCGSRSCATRTTRCAAGRALALTRLGEGAPRTRELLDGPRSDVAAPRGARARRRRATSAARTSSSLGGARRLPTDERRADRAHRHPVRARRARSSPRSRRSAPSRAVGRSSPRSTTCASGRTSREALAAIGEDAARPALAERLANERYQTRASRSRRRS